MKCVVYETGRQMVVSDSVRYQKKIQSFSHQLPSDRLKYLGQKVKVCFYISFPSDTVKQSNLRIQSTIEESMKNT